MPDPVRLHPVKDGQPDTAVSFEAVQHLPTNTDDLAAWAEGDRVDGVNGGPVVVVQGRDRASKRIVALGDWAVRVSDGHFHRAEADGFATRWAPAPE